MTTRVEEQKIQEKQNRQMTAQSKLEMQRYPWVARRDRLERAKNFVTSWRHEEAARMYNELEMYEKAYECRRISRARVWDRRVQ